MKKIIILLIASIFVLFFEISIVMAQELPKPDLSVWQSDQMKPIRDFANVGVGVIFGVAVLYSVIMIAWYGIKLQSAGGDPMKSQDAKRGLKATVVGIAITFSAIFIVGLILYVLGIVGVKGS